MSFIRKDVNLGLLLLLVVLSGALAALGVFFSYNYTQLSSNYQQQLDNLQSVTDELFYHKSVLNQTSEDLATKEADENELNKRFTDLRSEKETIAAENEKLNSEVVSKNAELVSKTNELVEARTEIATQKTQINDLNKNIALLEARVRSYKSKFENICDTADFGDCPES